MPAAPPILDETSLYEGIKNLATSYYDTTSEFNRVGKNVRKHFSFQTVKGMDWKHAVKKMLGKKRIEDLSETGKKMLTGVLKAGVTGISALADPEAIVGSSVVGMLTDFVFDSAKSAFEMDPREVLEQGTWVYIDRGQQHNKLVFAEEMRAEVSLFGDRSCSGTRRGRCTARASSSQRWTRATKRWSTPTTWRSRCTCPTARYGKPTWPTACAGTRTSP